MSPSQSAPTAAGVSPRAVVRSAGVPACRFCGSALHRTFVDLGMSPLCESYVAPEQLGQMEPFYPLHVRVCEHCWLVQLEAYVSAGAIFSEYAYFSSYSDSWLAHAKRYVDMIVQRLGLGAASHVIEVASNDGYLLQYFVQRSIPCLGIEPAANVAEAAVGRGVQTLVQFFGAGVASELSSQGRQGDLVIGNNVLAQVPDLNDFVEGLRIVLKPGGVITLEFPHLVRLVEGIQLDTIYHEHFSYFSLITIEAVFAAHGLRVFDVEELPTHGGSLRIYGCHAAGTKHPVAERVNELRQREIVLGVDGPEYYGAFAEHAQETKRRLLEVLIDLKRAGKSIAGYGAPGKGNTLLNYCGIRTDFLDYTVDRNPYKQGKFLPGTRIPIYAPQRIQETRPDFVLILPWNLQQEIMQQMAHIREWGGQFIVPIPRATVCR